MRCFYIEELKYLKDNDYIIYNKLNYIDELFIDFINEEAYLTPFKFLDMMENIFNNKNINYVIDSTSVISTYLINIKDLEYFYLFLRKLLLKGFVNKIIYKNEFIIIHYNNLFIKNSLCLNNSWTILLIYNIFKELNLDVDCYLYSLFKNNTKEEVLDLLFIKDDNYIVFSSFSDINIASYIKVYNVLIYYPLKEIKNEVFLFSFNKIFIKKKLINIFNNI